MYFEDLSMHRSINCASELHQNDEFRSSEKIEPISAICVLLVSRAVALSLVNGIKINVQCSTLFCLYLNYVSTLHL